MQLRAQREYALEAMQALQRFNLILIGPVAEGWAHAGSKVRIELTAPNAKEVEYTLIELGIDFKSHKEHDGSFSYEVVNGDWPMRLVVRNENRAPDARFKQRLTDRQLASLLIER